jgi:hypothetical protein
VLGAATANRTPFALGHPAVQRNRTHSPIVREDHGSESTDDNSKKPSHTGHGRLSRTDVISWLNIWDRRLHAYLGDLRILEALTREATVICDTDRRRAPAVVRDCCTAERIFRLRIRFETVVCMRWEIAMTANPWMFGLEAVQLGWQAQIGLALKIMRSFPGGVPDQVKESSISPSIVADDTTAEARIAALPKVPAVVIDMQESPAAIAAARRRKTSKVVRAAKTTSKKTSLVKAQSVSKRTAASQNSGKKAVRRSARKHR